MKRKTPHLLNSLSGIRGALEVIDELTVEEIDELAFDCERIRRLLAAARKNAVMVEELEGNKG